MKWELEVSDKSFDRAGITKDAKEAICEYIWNGYEAGATIVKVDLTGEMLTEAKSIKIFDNGCGIDFNSLQTSFGAFLASPKQAETIRIKAQTNKGKGRFSYLAIAQKATWLTVYKNNQGENIKFMIQLVSSDRSTFNTTEPKDASTEKTGTVVEVPITTPEIENTLGFEEIKTKLMGEFAWYLFLNREREVSLIYQGHLLDYSEYINTEFSRERDIEIKGYRFRISIIVWKGRVDNSSRIYYMANSGELLHSETTRFNKNTVEFFHAVYIRSDYFKSVVFLKQEGDEQDSSLLPQDQQEIIHDLRDEVRKMVDSALVSFLRNQADGHVKDIFTGKIAPSFSDDDYGQVSLGNQDYTNLSANMLRS